MQAHAIKKRGRTDSVLPRFSLSPLRPSCGEKGRTCQEIGAAQLREKSKGTDGPFKAFRREHKKRAAWIKVGKITKDGSYAWSGRAGEKQDERDAGNITLEGVEAWSNRS